MSLAISDMVLTKEFFLSLARVFPLLFLLTFNVLSRSTFQTAQKRRTKKTDDGKGIDGNFVVWTLRPYDLTHHMSQDVGQRQRVRRLPYMTYALKVGRKGQRVTENQTE